MSAESGRSSSTVGESERTKSCAARAPAPGSSGARNSTPCAAASSSIASARSAFASTCQALERRRVPHRHVILLPGARRDRVHAAGWQSTLFSLTSAAATYCGIMKPELSPPSCVRNAGSPSERDGFVSRSTRRSEMDASSANAIAIASSANASGWPWKLPLETSSSAVDEDERVVGRRVQLDGDGRLGVGEQVAAGAVHLRRAAERVRVLHLVAPAVRLDDRRALEQAQDIGGGRPLARRAGAARGSRGRKLAREPWSASTESAQAMSAACARRRPRTSASAPIALMNCVPLMSERPSFAWSRTGSSPTRASASAPGSSSPSTVA